jgi:hypothetical protein
MSLSPSAFRRAAIGIAAAAAIFANSAARAGDFTHDQCRLISTVAADVMKGLGSNTLSVDFRQSLIRFIVPNGKLTCDGPKEIVTPTGADIDAFNTIKDVLYAPPQRISLEQAGLRSVPRTSASAAGTAPTIN